jgi:hypothetical protein
LLGDGERGGMTAELTGLAVRRRSALACAGIAGSSPRMTAPTYVGMFKRHVSLAVEAFGRE